MRVLQINKYHYLRGGAERYYFEATRLLERAGHDVIPLSMKSERNEPADGAGHFLPEIDYRRRRSLATRFREAAKVIWNREASGRIGELVERYDPDIAHLHNIAHQLSGSIVTALARAGVPVVQTIHDYKAVCPAYRRFRAGRPCDDCRRYRYWNAVRHRCVLGELPASAVAAAETAFYRAIGLYEKGVTLFHAPSLFMKETLVDWGFPEEKIVHFPYTLDLEGYEPMVGGDDGTFLFMGRLSHEKGLTVLLDAAERLGDVSIVIAGEGPEREMLERVAAERRLGNVRFAGYLGGDDLTRAVRSCRAVLLPSEYDDNSPLVIYEAFALAKPVIGADRGGIPEMVRSGETGLVFPPGDGAALAGAIETLRDDEDLARRLGRTARERMEGEYGPETHLEKLTRLYQRAMGVDMGVEGKQS